ncbi:protein PHOSPHATE STARVATION RESPONSE 3-like isoform X1 [Vicia villosa]|uniref:protein PHOSPHATE STARVATION RESPONSE 3-like isoform X1 n=1 Tax=Vicia villosa TaxID=3911 RepID=UPI00273BBC51|nr:protein PHOSPHATE STARVATION RESPONSE 3-like isoform X1 [Vicia villosa]
MYQHCSRMYGTQWESYMGINNLVKVVGSEQVSFEPIKSPCNNNIVGSSFQGEEYYDEDEIEVPDWCFDNFPKITDPPLVNCQASGDNFTASQLTNSLYSIDESLVSNTEDSHNSSEEEYSNFQSGNMSFYDHFSHKHDELMKKDDFLDEKKPFEISFQRTESGSCTKSQKHSPQVYGTTCGVTSSNSGSRKALTSKRRIRWTEDLHESFMMIVDNLGGPEKAKPKAILDMMKSKLLSLSHVKSHLQKCRSTIRLHKALQERSEEGFRTDRAIELQHKISLMQIEESQKLQVEVRKSISQQLEMQRNLQALIEEHSKKLKVMQKEKTNQRISLTQPEGP